MNSIPGDILILNGEGFRVWIGFIWLRIRASSGLLWHSNGSLCSVKGGKFFGSAERFWCLKTVLVDMVYRNLISILCLHCSYVRYVIKAGRAWISFSVLSQDERVSSDLYTQTDGQTKTITCSFIVEFKIFVLLLLLLLLLLLATTTTTTTTTTVTTTTTTTTTTTYTLHPDSRKTYAVRSLKAHKPFKKNITGNT